jgi:signal transduction histidine kinase/ligand-binding sensor domain-containing protein/DNA-binding response OmpR family regulator
MNVRVILGIVIFFILENANAQKIIDFEYLGLKDGISQVSVTSMVQDEIGRIWIGTRDGLNVYDGEEIKVFRPIRGDSTSLLGHNVRNLELQGKSLWVITYHGVSLLNIETLQFKQFLFDGVFSIVHFENKVLLGTSRGLFELNKDNNALTLRDDIFEPNCAINDLFVDNAGELWICSDEGFYNYTSNTRVGVKILNGKINNVFSDSQKRIWVGTDGDGLYLLNRHNEVIKKFYYQESKSSLVNNIIRDIQEDTQGNIWVGTFLGLSIIDGRTLEISNYRQTDDVENGLSHNSIYSIIRDSQGTMWIGTYFGAVSYYNPDFHVYKRYPVGENNPLSINYHVVGEMLEDHKNNLWVATEGGGLDYFDREKQVFSHFMYSEGENGLSHNNVKSICLAGKNYLLIGTHLGGLNVLNLTTYEFESYKHLSTDSTSISSNIINSITPFKGDYLLGTHNGIVRFNLEKREFTSFITDKQTQAVVGDVILTLFEDSFGKIWIGTERNGLCVYDPETKKVKSYLQDNPSASISSNSISCIFEDHQFRIWIGTLGGGLNQFIPKKNGFTNYSTSSHRLPSDFIYGIQESRYGNLWVSTSKGLVRFDVENNRAYNYQQINGFPLEELNDGSLCLTSDGEVFIGGINGFISFNEEQLLKESSDFSILFTKLEVNNKEVIPGDDNDILQKDLPFTESITLKPNHNIFTISYSSCNYISSNQSRYEYQLENFDDKWTEAGSRTSVTYTNLDPGIYYLKIRVLSGINDTVVDAKTIQIIVDPPLYKTWYAYLIYVAIVAAIIIWLNHIYLGRVRLEDSLKAEKREKDQIKELNKSKLRFFTNISHEFRTPLTLITATLEAVLEDTKTSAKNYKRLLTINNNAVRLNNLISELLDFRKLEQGFLKLKVSENSVSLFLDEIFQSFVEFAHHRNINYSMNEISSSMVLWFDKKQMEKVFYNLISNAFKAVDERKGEIIVKVIEQQSYIDIIIADNGQGMAKDEIDKIFDRFYQIDRVKGKTNGQGSGIGLSLCMGIVNEHSGKILVDSIDGKGTSFTVRLQKGNKHFKNDELLSSAPEEIITKPQIIQIEGEAESEKITSVTEDSPLVLIVEDNDEARDLLRDIFSPYYRVIDAPDGSDGLNLAIEQQPDIIISDVMMPNMSGTQMCAKLKRNIQTSHIPIVLLTARTAIEYKIEGIETGADDYITKPFNTKLLKARIENLLQNRAQLQQKFKQDPRAEIKVLTTNSLDQKLLEQAKEVIEKSIDNAEFDVNTFAKELGLGRTRLYAKIKGITGQTPNEFILSARLKKAADMLIEQPEFNVSEIAYAVGFSTPRYFSRCFREHFGVSPSKYGAVNSSEDVDLGKDDDNLIKSDNS